MDEKDTCCTVSPFVAAFATFENNPIAPEVARGNIGAEAINLRTLRRELFCIVLERGY
jgi:hypothetical protein